MSDNNPDITASDIIVDVEARLGTPSISTSVYLPWLSYAYQKTYQALSNAGQQVKEELFGQLAQFSLTAGVAEYSISTNIPRYGGTIKVEIKYGATGDLYSRATRLSSLAYWRTQENVSTSYRGKNAPLYYILKNIIGFIPTPPATDPSTVTARVWYIQRPYQITDGADIVDIPYRLLYPVVNYVQSRAIERENEDYSVAQRIEDKFERELQQIAIAAASEYDENEGSNQVSVSSDNALFDDPLR